MSGFFEKAKVWLGIASKPSAMPQSAGKREPAPTSSPTSSPNATGSQKASAVTAPESGAASPQLAMTFITLTGDQQETEYAYLLFEQQMEAEIMTMFRDHQAIHPFAMIVHAGQGLPDAPTKAHIFQTFGYDTDRELDKNTAIS
jgi:hypothetical protein